MKTRNPIKIAAGVASRRGLNTRTAVASLPRSMHRTFLALAVCAAIGVGGTPLAQHTGNGHVKVTQLSQRDIAAAMRGFLGKVFEQPASK